MPLCLLTFDEIVALVDPGEESMKVGVAPVAGDGETRDLEVIVIDVTLFGVRFVAVVADFGDDTGRQGLGRACRQPSAPSVLLAFLEMGMIGVWQRGGRQGRRAAQA